MWLGEKIKIPWKNKVTKNVCEQIVLYNQHNPYQKIPATWVKEIDKLILKSVWELKELKEPNNLEKEKNQVEGFTLADFKTYDKATVIKTV